MMVRASGDPARLLETGCGDERLLAMVAMQIVETFCGARADSHSLYVRSMLYVYG